MTAYQLVVGDRAPVQHTATTCGAASLTVARMLADAGFAAWMQSGETAGHSFLPELASADARFAAAEQLAIRRTNRLLGPGRRLQPPWPRALGTPPWGARRGLEHGGSVPGTAYVVQWCRPGGPAARRRLVDETVRRVGPGRPAALYVGSRLLPRHVTLVVSGPGGEPLLYDPSAGAVLSLDPEALVAARLAIAGWDVPWCVVRPSSGA